ncbi:FAD-binding oxidoreductase [Hyphobacterium sp. CCMP332]|nr:FAD-binding oxidoreductase [Hyphobacterium sp. CCMP332]
MDFKSKSRVGVAVIGGGIAGLACAKALLERGAEVTVYEAGTAGQGALWASGGMLAGGFECAESNASPAFVSLAHRGMALWSDWTRDLGEADIDTGWAALSRPQSAKMIWNGWRPWLLARWRWALSVMTFPISRKVSKQKERSAFRMMASWIIACSGRALSLCKGSRRHHP